jgi:hypothetical protein
MSKLVTIPLAPDFKTFQRDFKQWITSFMARRWVQAEEITGLSLSTATTNVSHGLGRAWIGWMVTDIDDGVVVYRDAASTADAKFYLPLKTSAGTPTVNILVW